MNIAIIGGGFAGCAVAALLARSYPKVRTITLIERRAQLGEGLAYSTPYSSHLLNVRASNMSCFADDSGHFARWLDQPGEIFTHRRHYAKYLQWMLAESRRILHDRKGRFDVVEGEATSVEVNADGCVVKISTGVTVRADHVVLCLGHSPPRLPAGLQKLTSKPGCHDNPWAWNTLEKVPLDADVLLVGTGLTMVDGVVALQERGFRGTFTAVSRHGLVPLSHAAAGAAPLPDPLGGDVPKTCRALVRSLRRAVAEAAKRGVDWRCVVDGLRDRTPALWQALPMSEQARFLRHVRTYWEIHRHRVAPEIAAQIEALRTTQRLTIHAGRVIASQVAPHGFDVSIQLRGSHELLRQTYTHVMNCTGALPDYSHMRDPLVQSLFEAGLATPGNHGLGFALTPAGALIDAQGRAATRLHALGIANMGNVYESVAVPELRTQAATVAAAIGGERAT